MATADTNEACRTFRLGAELSPIRQPRDDGQVLPFPAPLQRRVERGPT